MTSNSQSGKALWNCKFQLLTLPCLGESHKSDIKDYLSVEHSNKPGYSSFRGKWPLLGSNQNLIWLPSPPQKPHVGRKYPNPLWYFATTNTHQSLFQLLYTNPLYLHHVWSKGPNTTNDWLWRPMDMTSSRVVLGVCTLDPDSWDWNPSSAAHELTHLGNMLCPSVLHLKYWGDLNSCKPVSVSYNTI